MATPPSGPWNQEQALALYNIPQWGEGYFRIDDAGHLVARPRRGRSRSQVNLYDLAKTLRGRGLSPPLLVRFMDILHDRVDTLMEAFGDAMRSNHYSGRYTAVYPIKVNQQAQVVREILGYGGERVGLEAGSKPELMAVLGLGSAGRRTIVCNGYKDREYLRIAMLGLRLGHDTRIVIEKPSELEMVLREAADLDIRPRLGIRLRLASIGQGKWQNTGGERSKFGLAAHQVLHVVERLRSVEMLDCLDLMHFHLGSQLPNIHDIQLGLEEAARYYAELHAMGVAIGKVDVGGGLGVDYEGTASRSFCSINYSVQEYANNVVHAMGEVCELEGLPHPDLLTESGRAMSAHHAMLITEVTDVAPAPGREAPTPPDGEEPPVIQDLWRGYAELSSRNPVETYHDTVHRLQAAQRLFTHGGLGLAARARAEDIYYAICQRVRALLSPGARGHREVLDTLNDRLADKYICNFSLFQSLPDAWAIDQIFPVVPLHRLEEEPDRHCVIHDLTCDSDGQIDLYVGRDGVERSLPLHAWTPGEPYLIGIFMLGAYQEILGDVHNLFGDTHSVNVALTEDGGWRIVDPRHGETVADVLRYVNFSPEQLRAEYQRLLREADLDAETADRYLGELSHGLEGYTYLEE